MPLASALGGVLPRARADRVGLKPSPWSIRSGRRSIPARFL